jgi:hypothetical protein
MPTPGRLLTTQLHEGLAVAQAAGGLWRSAVDPILPERPSRTLMGGGEVGEVDLAGAHAADGSLTPSGP